MAEEIHVELREPVVIDPPRQRPTVWRVLRVWLGIGLQSFGGGAATLYLVRQASVERERWLTDQEFTRFWAICQLAPGINLIGFTVLIGAHVAGAFGVVASLVGLLLPSVAVTIGLAAAYATIQQQPLVQSALRGIVPATVGIGLLLIVQLLRPIMAESQREGPSSLVLSIALLLGGILAVAVWHPPLVAMLWVGGAICAVGAWLRTRKARRS